jgi:hypothetical protein
MSKLCKTCGADETNGEFYEGRNTKCKECMKIEEKARRDEKKKLFEKVNPDQLPKTDEKNKPNDELMGYILDLKNDIDSFKLELNEMKNDNLILKNENLNFKSQIENLKNQIEALKISNLSRNITIQSPRIEISADQVEIPCKTPVKEENLDNLEQDLRKLENENYPIRLDNLRNMATNYNLIIPGSIRTVSKIRAFILKSLLIKYDKE